MRKATTPRSTPSESQDIEQDDVRSSINPDESLIPRSYWKISSISLTGVAAWIGILWLGSDTAWLESALEDVVSLQSGRLAKFFSTVALLVASQLSTLILWYRSKSRKDFAGRYRMWAWGSVYWSTLCMAAATGFHHPLAQLLYDYWKIECWRPETMYWLAPAAAGFAALYQLLNREFRQSLPTRLLWNLCAIAGLLTLLLTVGLDLSIPEPFRLAAKVGAATFWHLSAAVAMLFQARFVVHVNNESAPRRKAVPRKFMTGYFNLIRRVLMYRWPRLPFPKLSIRRRGAVKDQGSSDTEGPARPRKKPAKKVSAKVEVADKSVSSERAGSVPETVTEKAALPKPVEEPRTPPQPAPARTLRVDPPAAVVPAPKGNLAPAAEEQAEADEWSDDEPEDDEYAGMSRKERRKLRKLRKSGH